MSKIFQIWARNWGHIRATCESSCLTAQLCRDYGIEICFGTLNPQLSVSVSSPPDVATFRILAEGSQVACPWRIFQVNFGDINTFRQSFEWESRRKNQELNRVSGREMRTRREKKVDHKANGVFTEKGDKQ